MSFLHCPVMSKEVVHIFSKTGKKLFIDCTVGMGGHAFQILNHLKTSSVYAIDCDARSLGQARKNLARFSDRITFFHFNFLELFERMDLADLDVSGILLDPGISMFQLKNSSRGFSHSLSGRLDMRKDLSGELSAFDVVNTFSEKELIDIFTRYGEVSKAGILAKKIIERRLFEVIESTTQLRRIIEQVYAWKPARGRTHPAAQVFQALRIYVNRELDGLEDFLKKTPTFLKKTARIVFLTYHSIEDRIVKRAFHYLSEQKKIRLLKPFPRFPEEEEIRENLPSRSAKLRGVEIL